VAAEDVTVAPKYMQKMTEQPAFAFSFFRKYKAKTLGETSAVKVAPDRTIDSALLFQCFLVPVISKTKDLSSKEVVSYELSPFPPV